MRKSVAHMLLGQWKKAIEEGKKSLKYEWPIWYSTVERQRNTIKEMEDGGLVNKNK